MSDMFLQTRQDLANAAAARFCEMYNKSLEQSFFLSKKTRKQIYDEMMALGMTPKPEEINTIVGNDSWTTLTCSHCGEEVGRIVCIDVTYGEYSTHICEPCVDKMKALFI